MLRMKPSLFCLFLLLTTATAVPAQWAKQRDPRVPVSRDGKPNLEASTPRANGKPDLSGVWLTDGQPVPKEIPTVEGDYFLIHPSMIDVTTEMKKGEVQWEPWALAVQKQRLQDQHTTLPTSYCKPAGEPMQTGLPFPYKIIQTPRVVLILYEENTTFRQVFLDGRKPIPDAKPSFYGYSVGRWEGDTLVVETTGFNEVNWLDMVGHPHTEELRMVERFRRPTFGHLEVRYTLEDSKTFRPPITFTRRATLLPDEDLVEYYCTENEKDARHYLKEAR